jgi:ABC-type multidrug transport system ATPase subunit
MTQHDLHPPPLVSVRDLSFGYPGCKLLQGLSFDISPGLTLVQGGDGRGKSTLLRLISGQLQPQAGQVQRRVDSVFDNLLPAVDDEQTVAEVWLEQLRERHGDWNADVASALALAFGLQDHLHKPRYMLSTGSRRKLALVAAAASGAQLTLIDNPYAALDAASCRVVDELLLQAADGRERGWVLADHVLPPALSGCRLAAVVDLGE